MNIDSLVLAVGVALVAIGLHDSTKDIHSRDVNNGIIMAFIGLMLTASALMEIFL